MISVKTSAEIEVIQKAEYEFILWLDKLKKLTYMAIDEFLTVSEQKNKKYEKELFRNIFSSFVSTLVDTLSKDNNFYKYKLYLLFSMNYFIAQWVIKIMFEYYGYDASKLFKELENLAFEGEILHAVYLYIYNDLAENTVFYVFKKTGIDLYEIMAEVYCDTFIPMYKQFFK